MPITELLEKNALLYPDEVALIEINPEHERNRAIWQDQNLVEPDQEEITPYRREISWG